jgi:transcription elongation factor Elf1
MITFVDALSLIALSAPPLPLTAECIECGGQGVVNTSHPNDPHEGLVRCVFCDGSGVVEVRCDHCSEPATEMMDGIPLCHECAQACGA